MGRLNHEALREEVHRFVEINIPDRCVFYRHDCAVQICAMRMRQRRRHEPQTRTQKRPRDQRASCKIRDVIPVLLKRYRCAGNVADIRAVDAQILQFAAAHAAKFRNGLTILAPVIQAACYVHVDPLSKVAVTSATLWPRRRSDGLNIGLSGPSSQRQCLTPPMQ